MIRLEDPTDAGTAEEHQTVLIVAQEHSTEPASSWCLQGTLNALLAETTEAQAMRRARTWLFIPIQDPDGNANATFDRMTERFRKPNDPDAPPEIFMYTRYLTDYIYQGKTIDLTFSLHNVEANECSNTFCPLFDDQNIATVTAFNRDFFEALRRQGYLTGAPDQSWGNGTMGHRLYGWCALHFGSFALCYEVNDRYPNHRLNLSQLQHIGVLLALQVHGWTRGEEGQRWHKRALEMMKRRSQERTAYFTNKGYSADKRTRYDLIIRAY